MKLIDILIKLRASVEFRDKEKLLSEIAFSREERRDGSV